MNTPNQSDASRELVRKALGNKTNIIPPVSKKSPSKPTIFTSKIIEWDRQKGFGYLGHQKGKLFLHRKDFTEHHKPPSKGDRIHYQIGNDLKGRRCAVEARHFNDGGKITVFTWICLTLLVVIPLLAWSHFIVINKLPLLCVFLYLPIINSITYLSYKSDKAKARSKEWRIPEARLHFLELIGG